MNCQQFLLFGSPETSFDGTSAPWRASLTPKNSLVKLEVCEDSL